MKALVIAPQPFFSPRGTPFSVYYRTLITAELGVEVDLLTYGEGQDIDIKNVRIIRIPHFRSLGAIRVGPSYLKLFLDILMIIWTIGLLLRNRYGFVHAHEEAVFFCRLLKPIFRFKLVYDMHSSLPQQLTNFQFTKSKFIINLFKTTGKNIKIATDAIMELISSRCPLNSAMLAKKHMHIIIRISFIGIPIMCITYIANIKPQAKNIYRYLTHSCGIKNQKSRYNTMGNKAMYNEIKSMFFMRFINMIGRARTTAGINNNNDFGVKGGI